MRDAITLHFPQISALTVANLKSRYRKTWAGFLWVLINPLIMFGVQSLVFKSFLRLQVPNYSVFLLSGLLPWIFITQSLQMCTNTFVSSRGLLKAFQMPPLVHLFAQLLDNLINFLAAFVFILVPVLVVQSVPRLPLLLLPLAAILLMVGVIGMTWLLATIQVFFRDTVFILNFVLSVVFFLTPVFYPASYVPESYRSLIQINPLYQLIRPFQAIMISFNWAEAKGAFISATVVALMSLFLAVFVWEWKKNEIYFNI